MLTKEELDSINLDHVLLLYLQLKLSAMLPMLEIAELWCPLRMEWEFMIFLKITGLMKKLNFIEYKIMEGKFIKRKLSKLFQLQINLDR